MWSLFSRDCSRLSFSVRQFPALRCRPGVLLPPERFTLVSSNYQVLSATSARSDPGAAAAVSAAEHGDHSGYSGYSLSEHGDGGPHGAHRGLEYGGYGGDHRMQVRPWRLFVAFR